MWDLTRKDPEVLERYEKLTPEDIQNIPERGDGGAVFFGEGTEEEYIELERKDKGLLGWYNRLKNL